MRLSDGEQQRMEQRLALRFAAIGDGAQSWLERQLSALSPDCALLTRWCYSASPVSDWANYEFSLFRACAEHALRLREQSPLARELPEPLFLNYVLHPRVNEEELCDCRGFFYAQLRGRIEGLSAREAILAINEWNAEQVCYRATDERTISALGAWRSGFGRCGEESAFAVNVLRAAGIPARQVYTPRWAHCDNNHAWVEAYCGGAWHFFGACEPEEALDRGWRSARAQPLLWNACGGRGDHFGRRRGDVPEPDRPLCARAPAGSAGAGEGRAARRRCGGHVRHSQRVGGLSGCGHSDGCGRNGAAALRIRRSDRAGPEKRPLPGDALPGITGGAAGADTGRAGSTRRALDELYTPCAEGAPA